MLSRCRRIPLAVAAWLAALMLAACATQPAAPVTDQSIGPRVEEPGTRVVVAGDTLYSIAWEAGHDYTEVAEWNGISPPYRLIPGQKLRVTPPSAKASSPSAPKKTAVPPKQAKGPEASAKRPAAKPQPPSKPKSRIKAPAKTASKATKEKPRPPETAKRRASSDFGSWAWPAEGKILNYRTPGGTGKGLDIAGTRGQPVRAAATGRVVYVGSGLRGYGLLVILKHDEAFLSAYAHSEKVYVKEGDVIKTGQKIADMGSSGADRVKLHFEIRRRGVPVDPLLYLPKK